MYHEFCALADSKLSIHSPLDILTTYLLLDSNTLDMLQSHWQLKSSFEFVAHTTSCIKLHGTQDQKLYLMSP